MQGWLGSLTEVFEAVSTNSDRRSLHVARNPLPNTSRPRVPRLAAVLRCHLLGLPALAGELGATYAIPIIYVPLLMITHVAAFYLLARPQPTIARVLAGDSAAA